MKSRLLGALCASSLLCTVSICNASLVGDTVAGCLGPGEPNNGCTNGGGFDFFLGQIPTVVDPGVEFTHTQTSSDGTVIRQADLAADALTILIDGTDLGSNPLGHGSLQWQFTDLDWVGTSGVISGLSLVREVGLVVSSFTFGPDSILIATDPYLQSDLAGNVFSASFDIQTSHVPLPTALWLFGSGLLGLTGIARRKKAT